MRKSNFARVILTLFLAVAVGSGLATAFAGTPSPAAGVVEAKPIEIVSLESSLKPVQEYFNANRDRARVLVLVSAT